MVKAPRLAFIALALSALLAASAPAQTKPPSPAPAKPAAPAPAAEPAPTSPGAGPVIVVETVKGTFEFETYPNEAPKTVARIVELVNKRFYNGLRVHRVVPNFVVQLRDPTTRDMTRTHVRGAVAMAHLDDPTKADSQWYVTLSPQPRLDGKYTVFGKVISGMDVVTKLQETVRIIRVTVRQ